MSAPWRSIIEEIKHNSNRDTVLMISGGLDSMFLLELYLKNVEDLSKVVVFNFDHGTGDHAKKSKELIIQRIKDSRVKSYFGIHSGDPLSSPNFEAKARESRMKSLSRCISMYNLIRPLIVTAHHFDDNIEQAISRFMFGSSDKLFMKKEEVVDNYSAKYKPLIEISKNDIRVQAEKLRIEWAEDPSNKDSEVGMRNKIRNEVIPLLNSIKSINKPMMNRYITMSKSHEIDPLTVLVTKVQKHVDDLGI